MFVTALLVSRLIMKIQVFDNTMRVCVHAVECFSSSFILCNLRRKHPHSLLLKSIWPVLSTRQRPHITDNCCNLKKTSFWQCGWADTSSHEALMQTATIVNSGNRAHSQMTHLIKDCVLCPRNENQRKHQTKEFWFNKAIWIQIIHEEMWTKVLHWLSPIFEVAA